LSIVVCGWPTVKQVRVAGSAPAVVIEPGAQPTREMLQSERGKRLLHNLPQHRFARGREAFLEAIASRHEIADLRARPEGVPDRRACATIPGCSRGSASANPL
jgi:hypothetical protein